MKFDGYKFDRIIIPKCVQCGFCCTKCACLLGEWDKDKGACKYLADTDSDGKRLCLKYDTIKNDIMFGCGCSSSMYNSVRDAVKNKISG